MKTVNEWLPEIYRKAATLLLTRNRNGCCAVIREASELLVKSKIQWDVRCAALAEFDQLFRPKDRTDDQFWWSKPWEDRETEARVFALLLAAEIAEENL